MEIQHFHLFLNRTLANYFVFHTKLYRYQWYGKGEQIFMIHFLLKNFQHTIQQDIEKIAEHITFLDGKPFATMVKFIKEATLEEASADDEAEEIISQLITDLRTIEQEVEQTGIITALKLNDYYSLQFLTAILYNLKKMIKLISTI